MKGYFSFATVFLRYVFFEKYPSHRHMYFQYIVIQDIKPVMNAVTDKKSVTLLSHTNGRGASPGG